MLVMVEWDDSFATSEWFGSEEIEACLPHKIVSVGILYKVHERGIVLVSSKEGDMILGTLSIPLGSIRRVRILKVSKC